MQKEIAVQNLISLELSDATLNDLDGALASIEQAFAQPIVLQQGQRRELFKMGDKSEAFCRQTLGVLAANPQIVPPQSGFVGGATRPPRIGPTAAAPAAVAPNRRTRGGQRDGIR
jgi:hypothetical protein